LGSPDLVVATTKSGDPNRHESNYSRVGVEGGADHKERCTLC
jgi:hypothetical protein